MCRGIIGKKLGMTGLFSSEGRYIPVTVILAGPCLITQMKTKATDGYDAIQLGFEEKKPSAVSKPLAGHFKKSGDGMFAYLREFAAENPDEFKIGQKITLDMFKLGEFIDVTAITKGRGFSGVIKRHGFHGGRDTHGSRSHRVPGSVGCSAWPGKIIKGKKMPGHYGNARKTVRNLEIVDIRPEDNLILIKGAVPGSKSGLVEIKKMKFIR
jgi:large subunit ribosomal protein L3